MGGVSAQNSGLTHLKYLEMTVAHLFSHLLITNTFNRVVNTKNGYEWYLYVDALVSILQSLILVKTEQQVECGNVAGSLVSSNLSRIVYLLPTRSGSLALFGQKKNVLDTASDVWRQR